MAWLLLGAWELGWWLTRRFRRGEVYAEAEARARELGRPLVVVGAPDCGPTGGYGSGDLVLDLLPSEAPGSIVWNVCDPLPWPNACCVVFVSCVLEYVHDFPAAWRNLERVSGGEIFVVAVEPWTLTGLFYPGTRRHLL